MPLRKPRLSRRARITLLILSSTLLLVPVCNPIGLIMALTHNWFLPVASAPQ